jgi:hypothetical protein
MKYAKLEIVIDVDEFSNRELESVVGRELSDMFEVRSVRFVEDVKL